MSTSPVEQVQQAQTSNEKEFQYNNGYLREMGVLGYLALQTLVYPFERIKVLQQVEIMPEVLDENGKFSTRQNIQAYYDRHAESETFEAFYRGFGAKLTKLIAKELSIYTIADRIREKIQVFDPKEDPFKHATYNFISATLSGTLVETFVYPFELAKTRMICDSANFDDRVYTNIYQCFSKSESNIFQGLFLSLAGTAIYRGTQIGLYETLYNLGMKDYSSWVQLPASILITIFSQKITYPIDTIRRQLMLKSTPFEVSSAETLTIMQRLTTPNRQQELMRGWNMQLYKSLTSGLFLFGYKAIKGTFQTAPDLISKFSH